MVRRVISYSDAVYGAGANKRFEKSSFELSERLMDVSARRGDTVHTSGRADYVVRFLVNHLEPEEHLPRSTTCFAIAAGPEGIQILTKRGTEHGSVVAEMRYDDEGLWTDTVVRFFEQFRDSLEA